MKVETHDADGKPICYVCHVPVSTEGAACSASCYLHFAAVVSGEESPLDMADYRDHTDHDWFKKGVEGEPEV